MIENSKNYLKVKQERIKNSKIKNENNKDYLNEKQERMKNIKKRARTAKIM